MRVPDLGRVLVTPGRQGHACAWVCVTGVCLSDLVMATGVCSDRPPEHPDLSPVEPP